VLVAALVAHASGLGEQLATVTAVPKFEPSTTNCTVPVGTVLPDTGATVAVKVTDCPTVEGFTDEVSVTVVPAATDRVAEAAAPVPSLVEVTVLVVLTLLPIVGPVTLTPIAQLVLAAIEPALRLRVVLPAAPPEIVPPQVLLKAGVVAT